MADINVTINPAPQIGVQLGQGVLPHAPTHAPGGTDSLDQYYLTAGATGSLTGLFYPLNENPSGYVPQTATGSLTGAFYPLRSNPSGYVQGAVVRPSNTGAFLDTGSSQTVNSLKNFTIRPTVSGIGVLLSGEAPNTGALTGAFYPLNSNPSGYITGVDLSGYVTGNVVRPSETGNFITQSQTGEFYPRSNPSGFITGVDLSAYVTGSVVRPSETGNFITTSQTGQFVTTGSTGQFVTGNVVRPNDTGAFLTTGAADGRYALQSQTGVFVTTGQTGVFITSGQTGQFYPISNPSGYITGVDLSPYATVVYTTGVSGYLQTQITTLDNQTGLYITGGVVRTTGDQIVSGEKAFVNEIYFQSGINISGKVKFDTGFLPSVLDGEMSWNNEYGTVQIGMNNGDVVNPIGFKNFYRVRANQNIGKGKVVMSIGTVGNSEFILAQEAANIGVSGELIMGVAAEAISAGSFGDVVSFGAVKGVDTSAFTSGAILYFNPASTGGFTSTPPEAPNAKVITALNLHPSVNGTVFVRVSAGSVLGGTDSNVKFSALQDKDFISYSSASGFWYNKTLTTGDVSGISAFALAANTGNFITTAQTGQFVSTGSTGNFITSSQTGQFYPANNPSGYITGVDLNAYATTASVTGISGSLQTQINIVSGYAFSGYNDSITGLAITGISTKTINIFQRNGSVLSASFTDASGSGSSTQALRVLTPLSDQTSSLTVGTKYTFTWRYGSTTLSGTPVDLTEAPSGANLIVDVKKNNSSIYSTKPSIDAGETSTDTAATPAVLSTSSLSNGDIIAISIDQIGATNAGKGAIITFVGTTTP